jgi:hypothetical protein
MVLAEIAISVLTEAIAKTTVDGGAAAVGALLSRPKLKKKDAIDNLKDDLDLTEGLVMWLANSAISLIERFEDIDNIIDRDKLRDLLVVTRRYLREDHVFHRLKRQVREIQVGASKRYANAASSELSTAGGRLVHFLKSMEPSPEAISRNDNTPPALLTPIETGVMHSELAHLLENARRLYEKAQTIDGANAQRIADEARDALARYNRNSLNDVVDSIGWARAKLA